MPHKDPEAFKEYHRNYNLINRDRISARNKAYRLRNLAKLRRDGREYCLLVKQEAINRFGGSCSCCGESRLIFLAIDHVNGDGHTHRKRLSMSQSGGRAFYAKLKRNNWKSEFELQVLCHNCHFAKAAGPCPHRD